MTEIQPGKSLTRKLACTIQHRRLVAMIYAGHVELRQAGTRRGYAITWDAVYRYAAKLRADRLVAEKRAQKAKGVSA